MASKENQYRQKAKIPRQSKNFILKEEMKKDGQ